MTARTYARCLEIARDLLSAGSTVILDGVHGRRAERDAARQASAAEHARSEAACQEERSRLAAQAGIRPEVEAYDLAEANQALGDLKERRIRGAKVLRCSN